MFEGIGYHNQLKHFVNTTNPGPALILPDYSVLINLPELLLKMSIMFVSFALNLITYEINIYIPGISLVIVKIFLIML